MNKEYTSKQIIEGKLLAALDDEDTVAVVLSKKDCDDLLFVLKAFFENYDYPGKWANIRDLQKGLQELRNGAFGQ